MGVVGPSPFQNPGSVPRLIIHIYTCIKQLCLNDSVGIPYFIRKPNNVAVTTGATVTFYCDIAGDPVPTKTWTRSNRTPLPMDPRFTAPSTGELQIQTVIKTDAGTYECRASNSFGEVVASGALSVHGKTLIAFSSVTIFEQRSFQCFLRFLNVPQTSKSCKVETPFLNASRPAVRVRRTAGRFPMAPSLPQVPTAGFSATAACLLSNGSPLRTRDAIRA